MKVLRAALVSLLVQGAVCLAQAPAVKLLLNDQAPIEVPARFGVPEQSAINDAGDHVFISGGRSALFYRPAGSPSPTRLLQTGDPVPGIAGAECASFISLAISKSGPLAFVVSYGHSDPKLAGFAILTYNGSSFQTVANSPGFVAYPAGSKAGGFTLVGVNDSGGVAFTTISRAGTVLKLSLYIAPAGGTPVRVLTEGDMVPGTNSWPITVFQLGSFNNLNQVLMFVFVNGSSSAFGSGLYLGSTAGLQKVVANGDLQPGSEFLTFSSITPIPLLLNHAGQVAFTSANAIWLYTPGSGIVKAVFPGMTVPPPPGDLGGSTSGSLSMSVLSDTGTIVFLAGINGDSTNGNTTYNRVLMYRTAAGAIGSVAYATQAIAGSGTTLSTTFDSVSINDSNQVSFRNPLVLNGGADAGFFTKATAGSLTTVALAGATVPLAGGGVFGLPSSTRTRTLGNGAVHFVANVLGGVPDYWEFLYANGAFTTLMHNALALPDGHRLNIAPFKAGDAPDHVTLAARRNGGQAVLFRLTKSSRNLVRIAGEGDDALGGRIRTVNGAALNPAGKVVFFPSILSGTLNNAVYVWDDQTGPAKVAAVGDVESSSGNSITNITTNLGGGISPMNAAGQVAFFGSLNTNTALFVGSASGPPRKIARAGEATPFGGTYSIFRSSSDTLTVNSAGQVAFVADTSFARGILLGSLTGVPVKIVATGDAGPNASTFSALPTSVSVNESGRVFFPALLNNGPAGGFFAASAGLPPEAIALSGQQAPAGGQFKIDSVQLDGLINAQGDLVFRSELVDGSADSGCFLRRAQDGILRAVLVEGMVAPGTSGTFGTLDLAVPSGTYMSLKPSSELLIRNLTDPDGATPALYRYRTNGVLEKIFQAGDAEPSSGSGTLTGFGATFSSVISGNIMGGSFQRGLYAISEVAADLRVTLTGPASSPVLANSIYVVTVSNLGGSTATATTLNLQLPQGADVFSLPAGCTGAGTLTCSLPQLAASRAAQIELPVRWSAAGSRTITASVTAAEPDPALLNNSAEKTTTITDFSLSLVRSKRSARNGTSPSSVMQFQIVGVPDVAAVALSCDAGQSASCVINRTRSGGVFEVTVRAQRPRRLRSGHSPSLSVALDYLGTRRTLTVPVIF